MYSPEIELATPRFQSGRLRPLCHRDRCCDPVQTFCKILAHELKLNEHMEYQKNQGVFVKHSVCPRRQQSPKRYF